LPEVITFDIEPSDIYDSGFPLDQSRGLMTVQHNWLHVIEE